MAAVKQLLQPRNGEERNHPDGTSEIERLMRKVFDRATADPVQPQNSAHPGRDFETPFDLIERAAAALDVLANRCRQLESQMAEAAERTKVEAAAQEQVIGQWKKLASGMKTHAEDADKRAEAMKARLEAAEARAATAEARAVALKDASDAAAHQAMAAETLSTELHDKVVAAFGIGSRAHVALEAVATRTVLDEARSAA